MAYLWASEQYFSYIAMGLEMNVVSIFVCMIAHTLLEHTQHLFSFLLAA